MKRLAAAFHWLRDLIQVLVVCRVSVIILALGAVFLIAVPQGQEVLQAIGESHQDRVIDVKVWLFVAVLFWAASIWYWARILLAVAAPDIRADTPNLRLLRRHLPRWLGIGAILAISGGLLHAAQAFQIAISRQYTTGENARLAVERLHTQARLYLGLAALFTLFVYLRRHWLGDLHKDPALLRHTSFQALPCASRRVLMLSILIASGFLLFFSIRPLDLRLAGDMGSGAILLIAGASWVGLGSVLVWWGHRYHFPFLTLLVGLALAFSQMNDNHIVRTLPQTPGPLAQRPSLRTQFLDWLAARKAEHRGQPGKIPVFIVTAAGGGIRAAYWTASFLSAVQDRQPAFARHIFAISSVSGGSYGAAVFDALLAEQQARHLPSCPDAPGGPLLSCTRHILGDDFLSPSLGAMLFPDFIQWFLPFPIPYLDRSVTMEETWAQAWQKTTGTDYFRQPFSALWNHAPGQLPYLILNSTAVEFGNQALASDLTLDPTVFTDTENISRALGQPMRFSTAVNNSARFGYIDPAGIVTDRQRGLWHVIDGGYYEPSGATAASELWGAIRRWTQASGDWATIHPILLVISNDPINPIQAHHAYKAFMAKTLAPIVAMSQSRLARNQYALTALSNQVRQHGGSVISVGLINRGVPIPLGWMLSDSSKGEIDDQLHHYFQAPARQGAIAQIDALLGKAAR